MMLLIISFNVKSSNGRYWQIFKSALVYLQSSFSKLSFETQFKFNFYCYWQQKSYKKNPYLSFSYCSNFMRVDLLSQPAITCSKLIIETRTRCEICLKFTITTPKSWRRSVFINFEHISRLVLVFLQLTLSRLMPADTCPMPHSYRNQPIYSANQLYRFYISFKWVKTKNEKALDVKLFGLIEQQII